MRQALSHFPKSYPQILEREWKIPAPFNHATLELSGSGGAVGGEDVAISRDDNLCQLWLVVCLKLVTTLPSLPFQRITSSSVRTLCKQKLLKKVSSRWLHSSYHLSTYQSWAAGACCLYGLTASGFSDCWAPLQSPTFLLPDATIQTICICGPYLWLCTVLESVFVFLWKILNLVNYICRG